MAQSPSNMSIFQRAIAIFRPHRQVIVHANNLLQQFSQQQQVMTQLIPCLAEIAMFVAESSQQLRDLKGRRISGIGLSFSRLISNCTSIPLIIDQLSKFIKCVPINPNIMLQIEQCIQKAKSTCQFMQQFQQYVNLLSLVLVDCVKQTKYKQFFIELACMMYIDCTQHYISIQSNTDSKSRCLLASIFYFMIRYSLDYIYPKSLKNDRNSEKRVIIAKILAFLLDIFQVQNIQYYKKIADKFDIYAQQLINKLILRTVGSDTDFFSPFIIYLNYKQLQNRYQKSLQSKDIDLRVFRKQKSNTPINRQALFFRVGMKNYDTLSLSKSMSRQYKSHRMLNFDEAQQKQKFPSKLCNNPEIGIKRRMIQSLSHSFSASFNKKNSNQVPQGVHLEIYRYIKTLTRQNQGPQKSYNRQILKNIERIISKKQLSIAVSKQSLQLTIYCIYQNLHEKLISQQGQLGSFSNCILAIAFFIIQQLYLKSQNQKYIINYMQEDFSMKDMIKLWFCLDYLQKNDENLVPKLRKMYEIQKQQILTHLIWKDNKYIDQIAELAANYSKPYIFICFSQALLQYCEIFYQNIFKQLQISSQLCIYAYNSIKFILSANGNILQGCHLDQILMCSLYIAGKTIGQAVLFTNIKQAYQIVTKDKNTNYIYIFNKVVEDYNGSGDIIYFYNKYFIENIQPFVPYMANPSLSLLHPLFQRQLDFKPNINHFQNALNLMDTQKPKAPGIFCKGQQKQNKIAIVIKSQRNQTRVRIRPPNSLSNHLCQTQKAKANKSNSMEINEEE